MTLQESGENYLEMILILEEENDGIVRSIDIATRMNYTKASISRAMSVLKANGYITMDRNLIELTSLGRSKAVAIYERHLTISVFLEQVLSVSKETATNDACRIEHIISDETFDRIKDAIHQNQSQTDSHHF